MIDIEALKEAMADVAAIGQHEHTFNAGGTEITMWPPGATADREIFQYSQVAYEGNEDIEDKTVAQTTDYMARFRLATVSHSIVKVGDLDLREVNEIATGEKTEQGVPVKVQRYQAVRSIIERWAPALIDQLYLQWGALQRELELKAERAVQYVPADLDAELDRINAHLTYLLGEVNKQENPSPPQVKRIKDEITRITELKSNKVVTPREAPQAAEEPAPKPPPAPQVAAPHGPPPAPKAEDQLGVPIPEQASKPEPPQRQVAPPPAREPKRLEAPQAPVVQDQPADFEKTFRENNPDIPEGVPIANFTATGDSMLGDDEMRSAEQESQRQAMLRRSRLRKNIEEDLEQQRLQEEALQEARQSPQGRAGTWPPSPQGAPHEPAREISENLGGVPHAASSVPRTPTTRPMEQPGRPVAVKEIAGQKVPQEIITPRDKRMNEQRRAAKVTINPRSKGQINPRFRGGGQT